MKTTVEQITPTKAQALLDKHLNRDRQRNPAPAVIAAYARTMKAGQWLLTHQGVAIDDKGELIDGQQRLFAIVESGVTVPMMVTRDVPHNGQVRGQYAIDAIDRGHERQVGQQLALRHGIQNGSRVAAVTRAILELCCISIKQHTGKLTVANALHVLRAYKDEIGFVVANRSKDYRISNSHIAGVAAWAMKPHPNEVEEFYMALSTGENLSAGNPALTCRRWLMNQNEAHTRRGEYAAVLNAAMHQVNGKQIRQMFIGDEGYNFFLGKQQRTVKKVLRLAGFEV